jgi:hypothetical protein
MGFALLAVVAPVVPARAQERQGGSPLAMVPDKAPLVISVRGVQGTTERALKMAKNAFPDLVDKAKEHIDEGMKKLFEGRGNALKGLAEDGPIFVAMMDLPEPGGNEPNMAVIARVKDFKTFREGLLKEDERKESKTKDGIESVTIDGKASFLVHAGEYAVLTTNEATAQAFAKKKVKGLDQRLDAASAKRLLDSDVGVYVDMGVILEKYAEQIRQAQDQVNDGLNQVENLGKMDKAQLKVYKLVLDAMFRTIQDSRTLVYTASFKPEGLSIHFGLGLAKDSATAKLLKDMKPGPSTGLDRLPARALTYLGMEFDAATYKLLQPLLQGMFADEGSDQAKKVKKALDQLVAAGPRSFVTSQAVPAKGLSVLDYEDPAKALDASLQLLEAVAKNEQFRFMPIKDGITVKRKAQNYRGTEWSEVSMKWDLDKMFAEVPFGGEELIKGMKKITGEGENIWMGVVDKQVIAATAKDWKSAKNLIDEYLEKKGKPASADKAFAAVRGQLPKEATFVELLDMAQYLDLVLEMVRPILAAAGQDVEIPASKEKQPGYVGVSATLLPRNVGGDVFISAGAAREVYRVIDPFIKKFAGGAF